MDRAGKRTTIIATVIIGGLMHCTPVWAQNSSAIESQAIQTLHREIGIGQILIEMRADTGQNDTVFRGVHVVDPVEETVSTPLSVLVSRGRISWIGDVTAEPDLDDAIIIDGQNMFLSPGLVDMHVHSESASSWLLNLANGVTTIREMGGFPWMLAARDNVNGMRLLGPTMYVAGTIINQRPLGGYAVNPVDAINTRRIVRQQAACGYDFIKVHNILSRNLLETVATEADRHGLDLVGHVPHEISVRDSISFGMRTLEHLKGYLDDSTLRLGDTDYASASLENVWITPTLYGLRQYGSSEDLQSILASPEMRYVAPETRSEWQELVSPPENFLLTLFRNAMELKREIVRSLVANDARFLAGTDASNYPFQVMGFGLVEELELMHRAGVPLRAVVRAATSEPAIAMRVGEEFGLIRVGQRADLVLLEQNPLETLSAYRSNSGVMTRGIWLSREALDDGLARLADIYAQNIESSSEPEQMVAHLTDAGFVFNPRILVDASTAYSQLGLAVRSQGLTRASSTPDAGPCAANYY